VKFEWPVRRIFAFLLLLTMLAPSSGFGLESHSGKVTLLPDHKYYDALSNGIRKAKKEIVGCFFLFNATDRKGNLPMALAGELVAARKRGVKVSLELEQSASGKGTVYEQNRKAAAFLLEGGVNVRFDAPKTVAHVKAMVIDGRYVYLGSHNITQSALKYNNELSLLIDSPELAAEVTAYLKNF
jgi:phosphatidylserine/phosphatidylglycerophosphate/cardiolipin synthase-like enzyme